MSLFYGSLIPALDANGDPISGAKWKFYLTSSSTPATVYGEADLSGSLGDTVTADAAGRFVSIYLDDAITYRAVLTDSSGTPISPYDIDPVVSSESATTRETLTGDRTYYVRTNGSDSNTGLANTAGGAFLTLQKAINEAYSLDLNGYRVTINVADGTYTQGIKLYGPLIGAKDTAGRPLQIIGNEGAPGNVIISVTGDNAVETYNGAYVLLAGMEFRTTSSGYLWLVQQEGVLEHRNCILGVCASEKILTTQYARVRAIGTLTVSGNAVSFCHGTKRSHIDFDSQTIAFVGSPVFSTYLWGVNDATINLASATITGTPTGGITVHQNGFMNVSSLTGSYLGGSAPVVTNGGYISTGDLGATASFYVRPSGNNNNDGLVNSDARAFATLDGALAALQKLQVDATYNAAGGGVRAAVITVAAGTYTGSVTLRDVPNFSVINIVGDETTPANVHFNVTGNAFTAESVSTKYHLRGMRITATGGNAITANRGSEVSFRKIEFAAASVNILAETGSVVIGTGNYEIRANAAYHIIQRYGSIVDIPNAVVTLTGTPAFTTFHYSKGGMARWTGTTFSGAATGVRYEVLMNGAIDTNGGGATFLPGNSAGSATTGGQYV